MRWDPVEIGQGAFVWYAACMCVGSMVWVCLNPTVWRDLFLFITGEFPCPPFRHVLQTSCGIDYAVKDKDKTSRRSAAM